MSHYQKLIAKRNSETRRLYVWGEITEDTAGGFIEKMDILLSRSSDPVWVLIHSLGGSVSAAFTMLDEIDAARDKGIIVKTCALGLAYSAGAFLLSMGTPGYRYVRPSSSVMLHPVSYSLGMDYAEMQERASAFHKHESERMNRRLAEACKKGGKKYPKFLKDVDKGLWLNAEEAVSYGVADEIWRGSLPFDEKDSDQRPVSDCPE